MFEEREAAGKPSHCENYLTDTFRQTAQHPLRCLSISLPFSPLSFPPSLLGRHLLSPRLVFFPLLAPSLPLSHSLTVGWYRWCFWGLWMGSGRVGRGGGCKGGPDNNVTIRPAPRTSRAVEESESKQWSVAEGVSGSGEGRGERGVRRGGQSPRVLAQAAVWRGPNCECVCEHTGWLPRGQGGHKVAALQCWHVVCICKSVFWKLITAPIL